MTPKKQPLNNPKPMNNYVSPWQIFVHYEGAPTLPQPSINPEIYYS